MASKMMAPETQSLSTAMSLLAPSSYNYEFHGCSSVVTAFYTETESGAHDEIDFEFVGNRGSQVQTNYFVDG